MLDDFSIQQPDNSSDVYQAKKSYTPPLLCLLVANHINGGRTDNINENSSAGVGASGS